MPGKVKPPQTRSTVCTSEPGDLPRHQCVRLSARPESMHTTRTSLSYTLYEFFRVACARAICALTKRTRRFEMSSGVVRRLSAALVVLLMSIASVAAQEIGQ